MSHTKQFSWGDKLQYKGDNCLFISYYGSDYAYVLLFGALEQTKVNINDLFKPFN